MSVTGWKRVMMAGRLDDLKFDVMMFWGAAREREKATVAVLAGLGLGLGLGKSVFLPSASRRC